MSNFATFQLDGEEIDNIQLSLSMRKNCIETGDPYLSAQDLKNQGKEASHFPTPEQMETLIQLHTLIKKLRL
jgi:hypothetical protein